MWTFSEGKHAPKVWGWEFLWVGEFHRIASGKNILLPQKNILRKGQGVSGAGSWHIFFAFYGQPWNYHNACHGVRGMTFSVLMKV